MTPRFPQRLIRLYQGWHGHPPQEVCRVDAEWADGYGLVGKRATYLVYLSEKLIEDGDDGDEHGYEHKFKFDRKPCRIWDAFADGTQLRSVGATQHLDFLGYAIELWWQTPDGGEEGLTWKPGDAFLVAPNGRRFAIIEKRKHLVSLIGTGTRVTARGLDDRR